MKLSVRHSALLAVLRYTLVEALVMATSTNAELLTLSGKRNPYLLEDLSLVADPGNFLVIMKDGTVYKNKLAN